MGTPLNWKFFTLQKKYQFHLLQGWTRAQKNILKIVFQVPCTYVISPPITLTHIQTPMGVEYFEISHPFKVSFFVWKSYYTRSSTLENTQNSLKVSKHCFQYI